MFKLLAIISLVASGALAQTAVIPTGISSGCSSFLTKLNSDDGLKTCLTSVNTATADYQPGSDASKDSSAAKVGSTLSNLCSSSVNDACPENLVRGNLADFYAGCSAELTSNPNTDVVKIYDILYTLLPLKAASCSKDDSGNYCASQAKLPSTVTAAQVQQVLAGSSSTPDTNVYRTYSIPFLFTTSDSDNLCTVCTRNIMTAYMNFEAKVPYGPGLAKSVLLNNQPALYQSVVDKCGSTFLNGAGAQAAGGLSGDSITGGAVAVGASGLVTAGMGALVLLLSSAF